MATKVIVGDKTIVKKVVVGVPQSQNIAAQGLIATLGDVDGTVNRSNGVLLRYDSDAAKWKHIQLKTALAQNISITNVPNVGGTLAFDSNAGGVFTFTGPTPTQIRQHYSAFSQNNDLLQNLHLFFHYSCLKYQTSYFLQNMKTQKCQM